MVCIYCGSTTQVKNSRTSAKYNTVWRRRACLACSSIFTTLEETDLGGSFVVKNSGGKLHPFNRDKLFIDIYESCRHRPTATEDASSLIKIITSLLLKDTQDGVISSSDIVKAASLTLKRFDSAAAVIYEAYHSKEKS